MKTIGFRGTLFSDTPIFLFSYVFVLFSRASDSDVLVSLLDFHLVIPGLNTEGHC